jgi:hypothetical protein
MQFLGLLNGFQSRKKAKKRHRPVRLRANARSVWPGGHLRLRAKVKSAAARASASRKAVLKVRRGGKWRRVGTMKLHGVRYTVSPSWAGRAPSARRFRRPVGVLHTLGRAIDFGGTSGVLRVRIGKRRRRGRRRARRLSQRASPGAIERAPRA